MLALLAYQCPNLLLLDEPTNHLDLEMRQALAVALQEYEGAVVLVSHDRHLLRVLADQLLLVHDTAVTDFEGDLEDYERWLAASSQPSGEVAPSVGGGASAGAMTAAVDAGTAPESADARKQRKRAEAERRNALAPLRAAIAEHERELERLHAAQVQIDAQLGVSAVATPAQKGRLRELLEERARLSKATAVAEAAWMEAATRLEEES